MSSIPSRSIVGAACRAAVCLVAVAGVARAQVAHDPASLEALKSLNDQHQLDAQQLGRMREAMLKINNEARLNPEYRRAKGLKKDLNLPSGLQPLVLDDVLNDAAQAQALSAANVKHLPLGTMAPGLMATGYASDLAEFPINWQSSESTYRPTWNLGNSPVDSVGYGAAWDARNNRWAVVAIWADRGGAAAHALGLHTSEYIATLAKLGDNDKLDAEQLATMRETMLKLNNEARANPEYRKKVGSKQDLDLPSGLAPLVLDDAANKAAQAQAEYQASIAQLTHENRNYRDYGARMAASGATGGLEACGVSPNLQDYPMSWMKSDTHYRPTWNIVDPVNRVGYGAAKRGNNWYVVAVWRQVKEDAKSEIAENVGKPAEAGKPEPVPAGRKRLEIVGDYTAAWRKDFATHLVTVPAGLKTVDGKEPVGMTLNQKSLEGNGDTFGRPFASLRGGGILYKGQALWGDEHALRLIITDKGAVALTDEAGDVKWSAGEGGTHVEYQANDGNFCLYDDAKNWKWGSQVHGPMLKGGQVRIAADGTLQQLDESGKVMWTAKKQ